VFDNLCAGITFESMVGKCLEI